MAKHRRYCCHATSFWWLYFVMTVWDITTILGFYIFIFDQKLCNACGEKLSSLLCSQIYWDCNDESLSIKYGTQLNSSQTSVWPSQESHYKGAPARSHESGSSSGSTVSNGLRSLLALSFLKNGGTSIDNNHGALHSNHLHLQPFSRFSSLLNFAGIFLPVEHLFSNSEIQRNKFHSSSKISSDVFSLLDL